MISLAHELFMSEHYPVTLMNTQHDELEKRTYQHMGEMIAVSLIHGGPAPSFFASTVVEYTVYGLKKVKASVFEVPYSDIVKKLKEVSLETVWYHYILEKSVSGFIAVCARVSL